MLATWLYGAVHDKLGVRFCVKGILHVNTYIALSLSALLILEYE